MATPLKKIAHKIKKIPHERLYELLIAACALIVLAIAVSFITPYSQESKYELAEGDIPQTTIYRARVVAFYGDTLSVAMLDGAARGTNVMVPFQPDIVNDTPAPGSLILVSSSQYNEGLLFYDRYRIPLVIMIVGIFVAVVLLVGRRKGLMSIAGLGAGIVVIGWGIVPLILAGHNALFVSIAGAYVIAIISIIIAHGLKRRTFISLACILAVLVLVTILAIVATSLMGLTGIVDEGSYYLQRDNTAIDLSGVLVGGIVIAALGALDDIVTTQVAAVDEIKKARPQVTLNELYTRAASIGGEHIASLVNTLVLVYVGAALPLILLLVASSSDLFQVFNSEFIVTEIVRSMIVSIGLVLAVPISTFLAAYIVSRNPTISKK